MASRQHQSTSDNNLKEKLQEEFLSCKICLEPLKKPKALPCLHSFCLLCLKGYVHRNPANQPGYFACPMCRKGTMVPPGGVEGFPDNFMLLSLADTIQEDSNSSTYSGGSCSTSSSSSWHSNSLHQDPGTGSNSNSYNSSSSRSGRSSSFHHPHRQSHHHHQHQNSHHHNRHHHEHPQHQLQQQQQYSSSTSSLSSISSSSTTSSTSSSSCYQTSPPRCLYPPSPRELRNRENDWYFSKVSRNASEEWLLAPDYPKGTFLIRHGEMSPDTYTLSVRDCDELRGYVVKHYKILTRRNPETLKESYFIINSRVFSSLQDLVKHYQESVDGLCCKLVSTCAKPRSLIWSMERGKEDEYHTSRDTVVGNLIKPLGSGQFAEVWLAKWQGSTDVAVKIQKPNCVTTAAFLDEAQILKTLQHPNMMELRGVCSESEPVYLLLEYMPKGQLSKYLREDGAHLELSQLIYIGAQIADAMAYMEKERFVHRNLGARNILVGENDRVKVAGFGMTKAVDDPDFNFRRGLKMAIKWMAPEVLLYNKYSTKADVWSFAVVLYEIFSLGKEPYDDKTSKEAFEAVKDGYRMEKPQICPQAVYEVMLNSWFPNAHSRPTFDFLNTFLHDFQS